MQDDIFDYGDEFEPRQTPRQASKFDSRPSPMVPEVSLIMDKPQQSRKEDDTLFVTRIDTSPTVLSKILPPREHDTINKEYASYAAWKEKQFPQQSSKTPLNHFEKSYSTNNNNAQVNNDPKQSFKPYHSENNYKNQNLRSESPNKYISKSEATKEYISRGELQKQYIGRCESPKEYILRTDSQKQYIPRSQSPKQSNARNESPKQYNAKSELPKQFIERSESPKQYISKNSNENNNANKYSLSNTMSSNAVDHTNNSDQSKSCKKDERRNSCDRIYNEGKNSEKRQFDHSYSQNDCECRHISSMNRLCLCSTINCHNQSNTEYGQPMKHSTSLLPIHCNLDHSHHNYLCCISNHTKTSRDTETIKNLLQVITSQNDQIKNLQKQIERLLRLHEQNLKERVQCTCGSNGFVYQNAQIYDQSQTANIPVSHNNHLQKDTEKFSDLKQQDEQNKQTFLEQKVSIGVMTSFELKVQNNPSLSGDNDSKQKNIQEKRVSSLETSNIIKNLVNDTGEMIRRKQNYFTHTPLENISEGSESHMSSLRQSNLNCDITRQSMEPQDLNEFKNVNVHNRNHQETENVQRNHEVRKSKKTYDDENVGYTSNLDYEVREPIYKDTNDYDEDRVYQYNLPYEELHSSQEDLNDRNYDDFQAEPITIDIKKTKNTNYDNIADDCLSLSSSELDVEDINPPSPEPSIHVDLQEYSSEGGSLPPQRTAKVGWTLYNNVVDQVNQILQNAPLTDNEDRNGGIRKKERKELDKNVIIDTVKAATIEQLTKLGISFSDVEQMEPNYNKRVMFDASCYTRPFSEPHVGTTSGIETNTSMHMKALAMKYLNEDQLAEMAIQKPRSGNSKQPSNSIQNTNMSFATMHYLQRYHLLPGNNSSPKREVRREEHRAPVINERLVVQTEQRRDISPHRYLPLTASSKISYPSKILDISTLKQQPKLL